MCNIMLLMAAPMVLIYIIIILYVAILSCVCWCHLISVTLIELYTDVPHTVQPQNFIVFYRILRA